MERCIDQEEPSKSGSSISKHEIMEIETENNHGKVLASSSNNSASRNKELMCKFCDRKFTNSQALGGHQNAHKVERAAAKKQKILSMASAYKDSLDYSSKFASNQPYGLGSSKTIGLQLQPLSLTHSYNPWPHMVHDSYHHLCTPSHPILNRSQPTLDLFKTLMAYRSGFHQPRKSDQPLLFSTFSEGPQQPKLLLPGLCNTKNVGEASMEGSHDLTLKLTFDDDKCEHALNSSIKPQNSNIDGPDLGDNEDFDQARNSPSKIVKGTQDGVDLALKL